MTCAKVRVTCTLITRNGEVRGENLCDNPQKVCPREAGEGYEKCKSVCQQKGHAETVAIEEAKRLGYDLEGSVMKVDYYYVCQDCAKELENNKIYKIIINNPKAVDKESVMR